MFFFFHLSNQKEGQSRDLQLNERVLKLSQNEMKLNEKNKLIHTHTYTHTYTK